MRWGRVKKICPSGIGQTMPTIEWPSRNAVARSWSLPSHPACKELHEHKINQFADVQAFVKCVSEKKQTGCARVWFVRANSWYPYAAPLRNRTLLHSQHFQYVQHFCLKFRVLTSARSWKSLVKSPPLRNICSSNVSRSLDMFLSA